MLRRLNARELDAYDIVPRSLAERVWVVRFPVLQPGADGMTLGRVILLRRDHVRDGTRALLAHELVHVRQFDENGFVPFLWTYWREYLGHRRRLRRATTEPSGIIGDPEHDREATDDRPGSFMARHRRAYLDISYEVEARQITKGWRLAAG